MKHRTGVPALVVVSLLLFSNLAAAHVPSVSVDVSADGQAAFTGNPRESNTPSSRSSSSSSTTTTTGGGLGTGFGALLWHHGRGEAESAAEWGEEARKEAVEGLGVLLRAVLPAGLAPARPSTRPSAAQARWDNKFLEADVQNRPTPRRMHRPSPPTTPSHSVARALQSVVPHTHGANCSLVGAAVNVSGLEFQCDGTEVTEAQYDAILAVQEFGGEGAIQLLKDVLPSDFDLGALLPEDTGIKVNISIFPTDLRDTIMEDLNITDPNAEVDLGELFRDRNLNVTELLDDIPEQDIDDLFAEVQCDEVTTSTAQCACPLDYWGDECQHRRPFTCDVDVGDTAYRDCAAANGDVSTDGQPPRGSRGYDPADTGDPPCLFFKTDGASPTDTLTIPVSVKCRFENGIPPPTCNGTVIDSTFIDDQAALQNVSVSALPGSPPYYNFGCAEQYFSYAVGGLGQPLALTQLPAPLSIIFRPWNFYKLSDASLSQSVPVPSSDLVTGASVAVTLPVGALPRQFLSGGRVYSEVTLESGHASGEHSLPLFHQPNVQAIVADQENYSEPMRTVVNVPLLLGLLFGLVLPLVVVGVWYVRRRLKYRKQESEALRGGAYAQMGGGEK